jgi:hypothetical protein
MCMQTPGRNTSKKPIIWRLQQKQTESKKCSSAHGYDDSVWLSDTIILILDFVQSEFHRTRRFDSRLCFRLQTKKHLTRRTPYNEPFSATGHHRNTQHVKIRAWEQIKSMGSNKTRAKKPTTRIKTAWNTPQIKTIKKNHEISPISHEQNTMKQNTCT